MTKSDIRTHKRTEEVSQFAHLPLRPGIGIMILNNKNQVFVGKRIDSRGWQMPQGGIDLGETPSSAALREMEEEIGCGKGKIIAESKKWYSYNLPDSLIPKLWNGKYCGQKQKWFLIEYHGMDEEINLLTDIPEFEDWQWIDVAELTKIVVPFKRKLYKKVLSEFHEIIRNRLSK